MLLTILVLVISFQYGFGATVNFTNPENGALYTMTVGFSTYKNAMTGCRNLDMNLLTIHSESERKFVEDSVRSLTNTPRGYWIGLEYNRTASRWQSVDGAIPVFSNFRTKPNTAIESNTMANLGANDGKWDFVPVTQQPTKKVLEAVVCKRYTLANVIACTNDNQCPTTLKCQGKICDYAFRTCTTDTNCPEPDGLDNKECRGGVCVKPINTCTESQQCGNATALRCSNKLCVKVGNLKTCTQQNFVEACKNDDGTITQPKSCDVIDNKGYCVISNIEDN